MRATAFSRDSDWLRSWTIDDRWEAANKTLFSWVCLLMLGYRPDGNYRLTLTWRAPNNDVSESGYNVWCGVWLFDSDVFFWRPWRGWFENNTEDAQRGGVRYASLRTTTANNSVLRLSYGEHFILVLQDQSYRTVKFIDKLKRTYPRTWLWTRYVSIQLTYQLTFIYVAYVNVLL